MATDAEFEDAIDDIELVVSDIVDDTERWTQEESAEMYEHLASVFSDRAKLIRSEMED